MLLLLGYILAATDHWFAAMAVLIALVATAAALAVVGMTWGGAVWLRR